MAEQVLASSSPPMAAIADTNNHRIVVYNTELSRLLGKYQGHKNEIRKGSQPGEFNAPSGVCWTTTPTGGGVTKTVVVDGGLEDIVEPHEVSQCDFADPHKIRESSDPNRTISSAFSIFIR